MALGAHCLLVFLGKLVELSACCVALVSGFGFELETQASRPAGGNQSTYVLVALFAAASDD